MNTDYKVSGIILDGDKVKLQFEGGATWQFCKGLGFNLEIDLSKTPVKIREFIKGKETLT